VVQRVSVVGFRVFAGCSAMVSGLAGDCFAVRLESAVAVRKPSASRGRNCEEEGRRLGSGPAASGCMMQFDKRKMSLALEMRDRELEFHAAPASGLEARAGRLVRLDRLQRRSSSKSLMRAVLVVPREVEREFVPYVGEPQRHEDRASALGLHGADEPLDDGDAAVLADRAEAQVDSPALRPRSETGAVKLAAPVADEVSGLCFVPAHHSAEKGADLLGSGLFREDGEADGRRGEVIEHHGNPPAERPDLRQSERKPGGPEARAGRDDREVHVPEVVGPVGGDNAVGMLIAECRMLNGERSRRWSLEAPSDGRGAQLQAGAGQDLRDALLAQRGAQHLQPAEDAADELGELVGRLVQLDKSVGPVFVDALGPPSRAVPRK